MYHLSSINCQSKEIIHYLKCKLCLYETCMARPSLFVGLRARPTLFKKKTKKYYKILTNWLFLIYYFLLFEKNKK